MRGVPAAQQAVRDRCVHPSGTWREFPAPEVVGSIVTRFEEQVRLFGARPAVSDEGCRLTYAELDAMANRVAQALLALGGDPARPVALLFEHGGVMLAALLGVLKTGGFYVPLSPHDPPARLAHILDDATARLIVADAANLPLARQVAGSRQALDVEALLSRGSAEPPGLSVPFDAYAYLIYTSGSTGEPKGVIETNSDVLHFTGVSTNAYHTCPEDRITLFSTLAFNGAASPIYGALLNGACLCPFDLRKRGVEPVAEWLVREAVTFWDSVPAVWRRLAELVPPGTRFPELRLVSQGGDRLYREDVERIRRCLGPQGVVRNGLGTSEVKQILVYFTDHDTPLDTPIMPVGYPVRDTQVLLVDAEGREVPEGEVGEIWVNGRYLSPGYWRRPDLTERAFLAVPGEPGRRIYRTGDLGRWLPDGALLHMGRVDSQVKIRGYRIELSEVESALRSVPGVREAVVVASSIGHDDPTLHAYVVLDPEIRLAGAAIRSQALQRLPAYMAPATVTLLDALPLNAFGKVDRRVLQERAADQAPARDHTPPRDPLEERLRDLWQATLGIQPIGIFDDFFALGGTSLHAMALVSGLQPHFGDDITLTALFDAPTIAALATRLTAAERSPGPA